MPSDSPIIITDSSICIISAGGDSFTAVGDGSYQVKKKSIPLGIKLFGTAETALNNSGYGWEVDILDAHGATVVKVTGSDNSVGVIVAPATGSLNAVGSDELKHSTAFGQAKVTYNSVVTSQTAGSCKIRFR